MKKITMLIFVVLGVAVILMLCAGNFFSASINHADRLVVEKLEGQRIQLGKGVTFDLIGSGFGADTVVSMVLDVSNGDAVASTFPLGGVFNECTLDDDILYLASDEVGLQVVDLVDPIHPKLLGEYFKKRTIIDIHLADNTLFLSQGNQGIAILDIQSDYKLTLVAEIRFAGKAYKSYYHDDYLYVATGNTGLYVYDLHNLDNIELVQIIKPGGAVFDIVGVANSIYLTVVKKGIVVYDIADPNHFVETGQATFSALSYDLLVARDKLYVASSRGVFLFDIATAGDIKLVHRWTGFGVARKLFASSGLIFISDNFVGLRIIDMDSPVGTISDLINLDIDPRVITSTGDYLIVGGSNKGLLTFEKSTLVEQSKIVKIKTSGNSRDLFIRNGWLYIADRLNGVALQNLANLETEPVYISPRRSTNFASFDNLLYAANSSGGIDIFDISMADKPKSIGFWKQFTAHHLACTGKYLITASGRTGIRVIDTENQQNPVITDYLPNVHALDMVIDGNLLYVASKQEGLLVYRVLPTAKLELISSILPPFPMSEFGENVAIAVQHGIAYMLNWKTGLQLIDVNNPHKPKIHSTLDISGICKGLLLVDDKAVVTTNLGINYVSIADSQNPFLMNYVPARGISKGVAAANGVLYLAQRHRGVMVLPLPIGTSELKIISSHEVVATLPSPDLPGSYDLIIENLSNKIVFKGVAVFTND